MTGIFSAILSIGLGLLSGIGLLLFRDWYQKTKRQEKIDYLSAQQRLVNTELVEVAAAIKEAASKIESNHPTSLETIQKYILNVDHGNSLLVHNSNETGRKLDSIVALVEDIVRIMDSRTQNLPLILPAINASMTELQKTLHVDLREVADWQAQFVGSIRELTLTMEGIKPAQVTVTETDAKIPEVLDKLHVSNCVMNNEIKELKSLNAGLVEMAKSLAVMAHGLEKSTANPYEKYARTGSGKTADEEAILRMSQDFDMPISRAAELVAGFREKGGR